jgi:hypothetical protein
MKLHFDSKVDIVLKIKYYKEEGYYLMQNKVEKISKSLKKMIGRKIEIQQEGSIRRPQYIESFDFYYTDGQDGETELILEDSEHEEHPIEINLCDIDNIEESSFVQDTEVIFHIGDYDLLLATA